MTYTKEQAKQKFGELVERFRRNLDVYKKSSYNEAQVRIEFINPFFEALGWDVSNKQGFAEQYKEVIYEDVIKVGRSTRAPDYSFRIGGQRKFFVEAKKPAVNIKEDVSPAYQLRRYAWSAKLPLSVVTDFEEVSVFDCRIKPNPNDKSSVGRIAYYTFDEYLDSDTFDAIYDVFSKEAVLKGGFDKYAESTKGKKGTAEVDSEFLKEIESWRELLAKNIALRNPDVSIYELNYAVQKIIDRIIFLRICEDRGIEPYGQLQTKAESGDVYTHLRNHFKLAESKYNSGIFDFNTDRITPGLRIDDRVLKTIIQSLYYPKSPYEFSVLGVEILGNVYEQFLGKVIRLTAGHQAKVETKPEVKKAGGVYYTPQYIVDYIVKNTVSKLVEGKGKTPEEIAEIKILDPACGSGSFLIGAYTYLLRYHLDWYVGNNPNKHKEAVFQVRENEWYLTTAEKKRILLNNIFGVDIDPQAVEVTKLSLLLKVLEHESRESIDQQVKLGLEGVLPNLEGNIKCGNSLIGPDFYGAGQQETLFDEAEMRRINVFDWDDEMKGFGKIMKRGGFDCVIGNPPYFNIDDTWGKGDPRQRYIKHRYYSVYNDKTDILFYFLTKAVELCKGEIGVIVSRAFLEAYKADKLRSWLASHGRIRQIIDFQNYYVFERVGITTAIFLLSKCDELKGATIHRLIAPRITSEDLATQINKSSLFQTLTIDQDVFGAGPWLFASGEVNALLQEIDREGEAIGSILIIGQGMQTGRNNVFGKLNKSKLDEWGVEPNQQFVRARNSDIQRYHIHDSREMLLYLENVRNFDLLPNGVQQYLRAHEAELKARAAYKRSDCDWWRYTWPLHKEHLLRRKLYCPYLATYNRFAMDAEQKYLGLTDTTVLFESKQPEDLQYFLGLLNSRLLTFRFRYIGKLKSGGIIEYFWNSVSKLPIHRIDFSNPSEKAQHDKLVTLVDSMLELQKKYREARMEIDKELYEQRIKVVDAQIDRLVYDLYGLTEEEIGIVEER